LGHSARPPNVDSLACRVAGRLRNIVEKQRAALPVAVADLHMSADAMLGVLPASLIKPRLIVMPSAPATLSIRRRQAPASNARRVL
jgi:hypothetical protein